MSSSASTTAPLGGFSALVNSSSDSRDKELVITQVTPDIVTFSVPFSRGMVPIGGRSTAVRISRQPKPSVTEGGIQPAPQVNSSGEVLVYASTPLTKATVEALKSLGEVKWLVTPDGEHTMYIQEYVDHYPSAQAIGVDRCKEKKSNISWAGIFGPKDDGESKKYGFEPEVTLHQVSAHINHELTAIHHPSGTLIQADMLFNLPATEQYSRAGGLPTLFKWLGGGKSMSPGGKVHDLMANQISKDKDLLRKELQPILAAKWDRIIPCHGDVIESGGRVAWEKVWGKFEQ
ncbi:hypothetical protein I204_02889 [Kwoniella mangroviensis CBS 8886]|uniref:hypothetical protein n=1 Tax=Kwoniella mangroviensis CBS 8507 TaxID=1296122 RepID=UPI00080D241B|nr:uncharacterized protein I203_01742 [Kwoniella mangroviensis CBS 8507]OCF68362.1 hypothetical protein I203_01742 [Kwoniella mangroviensis CBS 8507]OCF77177.1 hypothetical protein I204_02889 [Kwoniella mangroviensis CBS 8886]